MLTVVSKDIDASTRRTIEYKGILYIESRRPVLQSDYSDYSITSITPSTINLYITHYSLYLNLYNSSSLYYIYSLSSI
jgi:repressor of nif and glnA expression